MKTLIIVSLVWFACLAFGKPDFPEPDKIQWLDSHTIDQFEALCVEADRKNKENPNNLIITYLPLEKWKNLRNEYKDLDEVRAWQIKSDVDQENGDLWVSGWGLFHEGELINLIPIKSGIKAGKVL